MRAPIVLVIDDDPSARQTVHAQLLPERYDLRFAEGGAQAQGLVELGTPPDLVICDLMMPDVDGYVVCRTIKAHPEWRYVPIIVLTALGARDQIVAGLEAGADQLVTKPIEGPVLRARVRSMLRVRETYGKLRAMPGGAEVLPRDERRERIMLAASLTAREREVLELLLLGRSHEDIALALGISERTSKFHQANLLAKLGAESRFDLLRIFA